jgi:predicted negative regulator of RcsB-dependent stress response
MEFVYNLVQENPGFFAWSFGVINGLWIMFFHFNRQSHDRNIKKLENDLKFDSDRRLKIFELKASNFSNYVSQLDVFGKKNQVDMPKKMQPIFEAYMGDMLSAGDEEDKQKETEAITRFSKDISSLLNDSLEDVLKLKYESNRLKLIATENMLETLDELESLTDQSFNAVSEFMGKYVEIHINNDEAASKAYQQHLMELGQKTQEAQKSLLNQMRVEIGSI